MQTGLKTDERKYMKLKEETKVDMFIKEIRDNPWSKQRRKMAKEYKCKKAKSGKIK